MKTLLSLLFLGAAIHVYGQNYGTKIDPNKDFNQRLKQASEKTSSITCDFEQVKYLSVLSSSNKSKGKFYYKKAQNICLEYSAPQGNAIVMNAAKFKIVNNGKATVVGLKSNPMMRQLSSMLSACMTGNLTLFGKESVAEYYETPTHYTVLITPTSKRVQSHLKQIILQFDKKDMTLSSMRMNETETDYTLYEFSDKKLNVSIDDNKFSI